MRGLVARFRELDAMVDAAKELRRQGFVHLTLYSPTPRHEWNTPALPITSSLSRGRTMNRP